MRNFAANAAMALPLLMLTFAAVPAARAQDLPAGEGRETLQRVCTQCHDIDSIPRLRYSRAEWTDLVYSMKDMGADATVAELDQIINYLTTNFGKDAPKKDAPAASTAQTAKVNVNKASAKEIAGLGFSDKEAGLIVDYRTKNGNIKDADALAKIDGVDPAKVQAAKDKMEF